MIPEKDRLSRRQYLSLCLTALLSPLIRQLPRVCPEEARSAAWLCPLAALPLLLLFSLLLGRLTKRRSEGEGMGEIFLRVWGKGPGGALLLLYALWMLCYGGFVILGGGERLTATVYPLGGKGLFLVLMSALGLLPALGRPRTLGRLANLLRPLLLFALLLILLLALPGAKLSSLLPVTPRDALPVLRGGLRCGNVLLLPCLFRFLEGSVPPETEKKARRSLLLAPLLPALLGTALLALLLASFGWEYTLRQSHPFFAMARNLRLFGVLERIEPLVVGLWVLTDFLLLSALLRCAITLLGLLFPGPRRLWPWLCVLISGGSALLAWQLGLTETFLATRFFPLTGAVLVLGLYPLTLLLGLLRKKV